MFRFSFIISKISRVLFENNDANFDSTKLRETLGLLNAAENKSPFNDSPPSFIKDDKLRYCPSCPCQNFKNNEKTETSLNKSVFDKYLINEKIPKRRVNILLWIISLFIPFILLFVVSFWKGVDKQDRFIKSSNSCQEISSDGFDIFRDISCCDLSCCACCGMLNDGCGADINNIVKSTNNNSHKASHKCNDSSKYKERQRSLVDLFLGLSAIVLIISTLVFIVFYLRYLKTISERELTIYNSNLEYNKKVRMEQLRMETAMENLYYQYIEQQLDMGKRREMIRQDEVQQFLDHIRKLDLKEHELKNAYLNKITDLLNKQLDVQKVDRKERTFRIGVDTTLTFEKK